MKRSISIPAVLSQLSVLRGEVSGFIGSALDDREKSRVVLAIDEAVSNVIRHGYSNNENEIVVIDMEYSEGLFIFTITDNAAEYNPLDSVPPDMDNYHDNGQCSGLGVDMYRRIMKAEYERNEKGGNRLILIKEK